ncbi:hypothetical protein HG530_005134 [Fusarium avenaceum]|nr:hypothetical protein HG530_005134 [Fusarium avenaceum]
MNHDGSKTTQTKAYEELVEDAIEGEKFRNELQAIADQNGQNRGTEEQAMALLETKYNIPSKNKKKKNKKPDKTATSATDKESQPKNDTVEGIVDDGGPNLKRKGSQSEKNKVAKRKKGRNGIKVHTIAVVVVVGIAIVFIGVVGFLGLASLHQWLLAP